MNRTQNRLIWRRLLKSSEKTNMGAFMADARKKIIKEIAEHLDCGYNCYYNFKSDEIINIPVFQTFRTKMSFAKSSQRT
jgi:hypothetical protein